MARKLRIEYPGAIYHVINRGDQREAIFKDDFDRRRFLETLGEWFLGTCTSRFNRRHKLSGHLFSGRYKAPVVDGSGTGYLRTVCEYGHLNPVRAKLLSGEQPLRSYRWSSYTDYLQKSARRPDWLRVGRLFGEMGIPQESAAGCKQFELRMEQRRHEQTGEEWKAIRRGWCYSEEAFRKELLAQMREPMGEHHYGMERWESAEDKAGQIVQEELAKAGWLEADLTSHAKGDVVKVAVVVRLRRETTMPLKWISARLQMGAWTHLNKRLYEQRKAGCRQEGVEQTRN